MTRPENTVLTETQFQRVCEACDEVLLANDSTIERIAIPWLHVIREHPIILSRYAHLFQRGKWSSSVRRPLARLKDEAKWCLQIVRAWRSRAEPWVGSRDLPHTVDFLFVSHLLNAAHAGAEQDFYFGGVANSLAEKGRSVVIVLINHSAVPASRIVTKWAKTAVPRVVLADALPVSEEIALHTRLEAESRRLRQLAVKEPRGLKQRVLHWASREALSPSSAQTLRWASQISAVVGRVHAKAIVVTHEGHAYERISFAAARTVSPAIRCIAYQHAALFRLQHAIKRSLNPAYNPDWILTAGSVAKEQLDKAAGLRHVPIAVLGSNRSLDIQALELERRFTQATHDSLPSSCLVMPEGFQSEYSLLFGFALECAERNPQVRFVLRTHPILSFESVASKVPRLGTLPENVELSTFTLEQDLVRCRWALYRGSTAVVQATLAGLRPVYLAVPGELTIDPLYQLDGWRLVVRTSEQLLALVDLQGSRGADEDPRVRQKAYDYCRRFFSPLDPAVLVEAVAQPPLSAIG